MQPTIDETRLNDPLGRAIHDTGGAVRAPLVPTGRRLRLHWALEGIARRVLLAAMLLLPACGEAVTEPVPTAPAPTGAALAAEQGPVDVTYRKTVHFTSIRKFVVPCLTGGIGEAVIFRVEGHATYSLFRDPTGTQHHNAQLHIQSATATGYTTGEVYRVSGGTTGKQRISDGGQVVQFASRFRVVHPGSGSVFFQNAVHRLVINAQGELVHDISETRQECI